MRIIHGLPLAPFVKKVLLACKIKKLDYEINPVVPPIPENDPFREISPLGNIPAFSDNQFHLADSSVICAYLDKAYPNHPLYPNNPQDYAKALWFEEYADTTLNLVCGKEIFVKKIVMPLLFHKPIDNVAIDNAVKQLPAIFNYLEKQITKRTTRMIINENITIADISLGVQFIGLYSSGIEVDKNNWPALANYLTDLFSHEVFLTMIQDEQQEIKLLKQKMATEEDEYAQ